MKRLNWKGSGCLGYPVDAHQSVTHTLEWRTHFDHTEYRLARYKGRVLLSLIVPHDVLSYYSSLPVPPRKLSSGGN